MHIVYTWAMAPALPTHTFGGAPDRPRLAWSFEGQENGENTPCTQKKLCQSYFCPQNTRLYSVPLYMSTSCLTLAVEYLSFENRPQGCVILCHLRYGASSPSVAVCVASRFDSHPGTECDGLLVYVVLLMNPTRRCRVLSLPIFALLFTAVLRLSRR